MARRIPRADYRKWPLFCSISLITLALIALIKVYCNLYGEGS
jgi:hypothetical protein